MGTGINYAALPKYDTDGPPEAPPEAYDVADDGEHDYDGDEAWGFDYPAKVEAEPPRRRPNKRGKQ